MDGSKMKFLNDKIFDEYKHLSVKSTKIGAEYNVEESREPPYQQRLEGFPGYHFFVPQLPPRSFSHYHVKYTMRVTVDSRPWSIQPW